MAFLLAGTFERRGQIRRIAAAVAAAVVFQTAALGAQNLAARGSAFILLMYIVVALPVAAGIGVRTPIVASGDPGTLIRTGAPHAAQRPARVPFDCPQVAQTMST